MAKDLSYVAVGDALKKCGTFRVKQAQAIAQEGAADLISGALMLTLGLRESFLRNVENEAQTDKGCFQITSLYHADWLKSEPGCPAGSFTKPMTDEWRVASGDHTALEEGFVPRFTPAAVYALDMLKENTNYALNKLKLNDKDAIRFGISAYNCGLGGAIKGQKEGDVDKYTTGGDYSAWVIRHRSLVQRWLREHPNWQPDKE